MFQAASRSLFWVGLVAVVIGVISIVWPGISLAVIAAVFAVVAFVTAVRQFELAFVSATAGPVVGHILLGIVSVAAGVGTLAWPGLTVVVLALWIACWAVVTGVGELALVFASGETAGERALYAIGGLLLIAMGVVIFARPDEGAVSLAQVFGLFSLAYGFWCLLVTASTHSTASRLDAALWPRR